MARVHILMAETDSPIAFNIPYPVAVYRSKRDADDEAKARNSSPRAKRKYYVRPADFIDGDRDE